MRLHAERRCSTTPTSPSARKLIDPKRAQRFEPGNPRAGGTIYLSAADERGMMVSFIQSNYMGFGSGVVVPGWGVSMQNRGHGFMLDPASPNVRRAGQAAVPHHHPGLPHQGRPAADELRRHGRQHAAAGPPADAGAHARPPASSRRRRATRRAGASTRASRSTSRRRCRAATVQGLLERGHRGDGDRRQLPGLRRRPVHLAARRSGGRGLRRRERPAARRPRPPATDAGAEALDAHARRWRSAIAGAPEAGRCRSPTARAAGSGPG